MRLGSLINVRPHAPSRTAPVKTESVATKGLARFRSIVAEIATIYTEFCSKNTEFTQFCGSLRKFAELCVVCGGFREDSAEVRKIFDATDSVSTGGVPLGIANTATVD